MQKLDELSKLAANQQVPELGKRPWALDMLKDVRLEHDIWALEFTFKPVRFISVEVPTSSGGIERKLVWYMVYHVRNLSDKPVRFVPQFVLHSIDNDVYYPDRIIATAMDPIRQREDPQRRLLNTVQISEIEIPPAVEGEDGSVWGVALWRDIDPSTDRFSIYIKGLTNAYKIKTDEEGNWQGYSRKTLQLNFWRPGDEFFEHESEIRFGLPPEGDARQQDAWRSRYTDLRKKALGAAPKGDDMAQAPVKGLTKEEQAELADLEVKLGVDYRWVYW